MSFFKRMQRQAFHTASRNYHSWKLDRAQQQERRGQLQVASFIATLYPYTTEEVDRLREHLGYPSDHRDVVAVLELAMSSHLTLDQALSEHLNQETRQ